ncbi:MAG: sarcosine oxidase subunit gamma [Acidimicrobiales bacterium]
MADSALTATPVARSPIAPVGGATVVDGWEHSTRARPAALRLCDLSFLAKVQVRAPREGVVAERMVAARGRAVRDAGARRLAVGSGPGEWLVLAPQGQGGALVAELEARVADGGGLASVVDLTHGRALMRLSGAAAVSGVLSKLCAVNLSDRAAPDGTALRTSVASLVTDVVRDDRDGERSFLLHCERSSGQYLFDALLDAGADHGIEAYGATESDW